MYTTLLMLLAAVPQTAPDTVVVCPEIFRQALRPWLEYRSQQGHAMAVVSAAGSAAEIRQQILRSADAGKLKCVVLVGDAEPGAQANAALRSRCVPTHYVKAEVNVLWGSPPQIATDNPYADLDGDGAPELAVGRLSADTPEQLKRIVAKTIAYERSTDMGPWRRQLNFVAGVGGFGALADAVLESATRYFLTVEIPPEYRLSMTYGSWRSPYCPDPRLFHAATVEGLNEGCWFWVYIGHGRHLELDRLRVPGQNHHIFAVRDVPKLNCEHGSSIALFLACYTGAFDAPSDCLAEEMLRRQGGPVAVIAGSRVTMPYAMTLLASGLMDECFRRRTPTLGQALLHAKRRMVKPAEQPGQQRAMLHALALAVSPARDKLSQERAEHVSLFNLIGDPLLRLRYPQPLRLEVPAEIEPGAQLTVRGHSPLDGRATVELVVRRDRLTFQPPLRSKYPQDPAALVEFQEVYRRANDRRLRSTEVSVENGRLAAEIDVPQDAVGACHVRVFVRGSDDFALGSADVEVRKKTEATPGQQ